MISIDKMRTAARKLSGRRMPYSEVQVQAAAFSKSECAVSQKFHPPTSYLEVCMPSRNKSDQRRISLCRNGDLYLDLSYSDMFGRRVDYRPFRSGGSFVEAGIVEHLFELNGAQIAAELLDYNKSFPETPYPDGRPKWSIAVDFDGVIHSYTTPWTRSDQINDPPSDGAFTWLAEMSKMFNIILYTCRFTPELIWNGGYFDGNVRHTAVEKYGSEVCVYGTYLQAMASNVRAIEDWFLHWGMPWELLSKINFWLYPGKPHALKYVDDRALAFAGTFPSKGLVEARPWKATSETSDEGTSER